MIKLILKHVIYDKCISSFMDNVISNFNEPPSIRVGQKYSYISCVDLNGDTREYNNVYVIDMISSDYQGDTMHMIIISHTALHRDMLIVKSLTNMVLLK